MQLLQECCVCMYAYSLHVGVQILQLPWCVKKRQLSDLFSVLPCRLLGLVILALVVLATATFGLQREPVYVDMTFSASTSQ